MAGSRLFLSAVSSEFGKARDALADALQAHDLTVRVQRSFRHDPCADTLLHQLARYIESCDAVVCLIGRRSGGGFPEPGEATRFLADGILPAGIVEASYTQWEFFLARHFRRPCLVYFASDRFAAEAACPSEDRPDLQAAFAAHVNSLGMRAPRLDNADAFRAEVLKDILSAPTPDKPPAPPPAPLAAPDQPIVLPYPTLGRMFIGRAGFMARLHAGLARADGGAVAIRAVSGMGGVGKSRTAVEYAWAHRDDYAALLWVDAETDDKLQAGLAALLAPLHLDAQAPTEQAARVEAVLGWLNAHPGWLLILDNVDTPAALAAAHRLMGRIGGGHVLLTSRLTDFPLQMEPLDLDVLALPDAAALLLEGSAPTRPPAPDDTAQAEVLAEELGRLALALSMAAATMRARRFSFAQYREIWRGNRARVIGWAQAITGYHHAVAETWQTSVDQLAPAGRRLLERLAFLAPDPLPAFLLDVPVPGVEAEDAQAALDDLTSYSLATRDTETESFVVHRLVQDVTRRGLEAAGTATQRLTEALGWVDAAFVGDAQDVRSWLRLTPLAPHADAVAGHADAAGIAAPTGRVMNDLAVLFYAKALHARAEPLMRRALAIDEASFGRNHPNVAAALNNLATLLLTTNRLGEAESLMRRVLAIDEANPSKDRPTVAIHLNNLAQLLQDTNRPGEAEPLLRRALAIQQADLGKDRSDVAIAVNNLADLLRSSGRMTEAEPLMRRALTLAEASGHPEVLSGALNNLALLLQETNRFDEAEPLYRRAIAIDEETLGPAHPTLAVHLNNLGQLLRWARRLDDAEPFYRRAIAIKRKCFGSDHPEVAITLSNLALLFVDGKRLEAAELLMSRALTILLTSERDTGHAHPRRDAAIANYRRLLAAMGRSEAEIDAAIAALWREAGLESR